MFQVTVDTLASKAFDYFRDNLTREQWIFRIILERTSTIDTSMDVDGWTIKTRITGPEAVFTPGLTIFKNQFFIIGGTGHGVCWVGNWGLVLIRVVFADCKTTVVILRDVIVHHWTSGTIMIDGDWFVDGG